MWLLLSGLALAQDADGDGWTVEAGDCDDSDGGIRPGAEEQCDGRDQDCDGKADWPMALEVVHVDYDDDGYGCCTAEDSFDTTAPGSFGCCVPVLGCRANDDAYPEVWFVVDPSTGGSYGSDNIAANDLDCNDAAPAAHPDAEEVCDTVDNDCDGAVDEDVVTTLDGGWFDADGDEWGGPSTWYGCDPFPPSPVGRAGDCDDADPAVHPEAVETCDDVDEDCDGLVDDDPEGLRTWYLDRDGDGLGDPDTETTGCFPPPLAVGNGSDLDDTPDEGCGCGSATPAGALALLGFLPLIRSRRRG